MSREPTVKLFLLTPESSAEISDVRILFCGRRIRKKNYLRRKDEEKGRKEQKKEIRRGR